MTVIFEDKRNEGKREKWNDGPCRSTKGKVGGQIPVERRVQKRTCGCVEEIYPGLEKIEKERGHKPRNGQVNKQEV